VEVRELKWGQALLGGEMREWNKGRKVDLVIGADLTYDASNHAPLVATLGELLQLYRDVKVVLAASVRNERTHEMFLGMCGRARLGVREEEFEVLGRGKQMGPFYDDSVPIKICWITRVKG
jgi:hypothetical protein